MDSKKEAPAGEGRELVNGWIRVEDRLPENEEEIVLVFVSGWPNEFTKLEETYELATYNREDGWILDAYPEWETPGVTHWMPLPEPQGEGME